MLPRSTPSLPRPPPGAIRSASPRIVGRLTTGVAGLLKRAGVKNISGWARFRDGKTVEVETETGLQVIRTETVVIATGSVPVELPLLPFGGSVISSTEALALTPRPDR